MEPAMLSAAAITARCNVESAEGWDAIIHKMPFLRIPAGWEIAVIPPFNGAVARFRVKLPNGGIKSVYADFHERLGYFGAPYWEVYPYQDDVGRCAIDDTDTLLEMIDERTGGKQLELPF